MTPEQGTVGLLAAILRHMPHLPGALCAGRGADFDCQDGNGVDAAKAMCRRCPSLSACRDYVQTRSKRELSGVIAGVYYPTKSTKGEGTQHDKP